MTSPTPDEALVEKVRDVLIEKSALLYEAAAAGDCTHEEAMEQYARAVIAALQDQWRPIEAAPRDGTLFLGFVQHNVGTATRVVIASAPPHPDWSYSWWRTSPDTGCPIVETHKDVSDQWIMTHWQPLPPPPKP